METKYVMLKVTSEMDVYHHCFFLLRNNVSDNKKNLWNFVVDILVTTVTVFKKKKNKTISLKIKDKQYSAPQQTESREPPSIYIIYM